MTYATASNYLDEKVRAGQKQDPREYLQGLMEGNISKTLSPLALSYKRLEGELDELDTLISILATRIEPVLGVTSDASVSPHAPEPSPGSSDVVGTTQAFGSRLVHLRSRLRSLIDKIEL